MKKNYLYEINFIRAIACLLVVMVHVSARFYNAYDGESLIINIINQVSRVGTPLFAVMSGFLLYNHTLNRKFKTSIFLKSRVTKIILPFIFWSIFYLVYKSIFGNYSFPNLSSKEELADFAYMFVIGRSQSHLYFIVLVIQFYILFIFIRKYLNTKTIILFTIISIYLNYIIVTNKFVFNNVYFEQFINSRSFLLQWIFYFMLGILLVKLWPIIHNFLLNKKNSSFILMVGGVIMLFTIFDYHSHQKMVASNRNILNMFNVPLVFLVLVSLYNKMVMKYDVVIKALIKIGNMSMGIYLIHPFVVYLYKDIVPFDATAHPVLIVPYFITVIAISIILLKILSLLPFSQYIITLVNTNEEKVNYSINRTKELIKENNPDDYLDNNLANLTKEDKKHLFEDA